MKNIKIGNISEFFVLLSLFLISSFLIYNILLKVEINSKIGIIEKTIYDTPKIYIDWKELKWKKENNINIVNNDLIKINDIKINKDNDLKDYYKMSVYDKNFFLSNDKNAYNYWFIAKQIKNNILYLYSHNSYKQTENSGYYLYNHLKLNDIILFNDDIRYRIVKTKLVDLDKNEDTKISINNKNINIIYFTCTPYWNNLRKVFFLQKVEN